MKLTFHAKIRRSDLYCTHFLAVCAVMLLARGTAYAALGLGFDTMNKLLLVYGVIADVMTSLAGAVIPWLLCWRRGGECLFAAVWCALLAGDQAYIVQHSQNMPYGKAAAFLREALPTRDTALLYAQLLAYYALVRLGMAWLRHTISRRLAAALCLGAVIAWLVMPTSYDMHMPWQRQNIVTHALQAPVARIMQHMTPAPRALLTRDALRNLSVPYMFSYEETQGLVHTPSLIRMVDAVMRKSPATLARLRNTLRGKRCAVVGSSSNLTGAHYGERIDAHDVVFRINQAPAGGTYAQDVGGKTDIRVINSLIPAEQITDIDTHNPNQFIILRTLQESYRLWDIIRTYGDGIVFIQLPELGMRIHKASGGLTDTTPSSGLAAVIMALTLCEEVSIFGFGMDNHHVYGYYYADNKNETVFSAHSPPRQDQYLQLLEQHHIINVFHGNRDSGHN